ncbi:MULTISPECIES: HAD-IIIA family hydrolase [Methylobacterium]|uniref:D,D-heptose 1,7-bisphosphate phosphatase n=4 Tax=Pseudomonadota TaxID=1224 RepID=A0ABQ4SYD7_9HYPH|nr:MULTISPECIES: HAD-IIIA family hydrolase [Methylobacterium]PIU06225.1 MAG: D,D-heptose 1,7-bisphosphate phosphatase [Methylobacterium sp. CG09_land_8_20_14_0_10_71_15]PIU14516.1 MAG: D,D-heptose 1,7-bisphosphate phosphatase [Methylobacterium sp. CG08_land_8_20_14_0_20_71_15]GBU19337.1 histidinol phosphate phosphatase [Methylobacterium sp.]GJE07483.1 UTP--glucose-1-phosphate uridylyltransferase [Methylobacterium jeotgali]
MQAVILAGGKGTRLAERLGPLPKPLVGVCGVPLLERQLLQLRANGVTEVVILVNHAADRIERFVEGFLVTHDGLSVTTVDDGAPRGTSGALLSVLDRLQERFLVVYGDTLFEIDVARFGDAHRRSGADATLFLHPNDHPHDSDLVETGEDGFVIRFHPKPHPEGAALPNLVNAAFYMVERAALLRWRDFPEPSDFGRDLFPAMLAAGQRLFGYNSFEYIKDLGTPARLDKVEDHLRRGVVARAARGRRQRCVFLDRDGTLNRPRGHVARPEDLVLIPGAAEAVRRLNEAEFRVALVTNQPVLARGECTEEGMRAIHARLDMELGRAGAWLDRAYLCPHHPDAGFPGEVPALKVACTCRKPEPGLILRAAEELNADLARSWMIGDTTSDMLAARRAGVRGILVRTGEGGRDGRYEAPPEHVADDLAAAVGLILAQDVRRESAA